MRVPRVAHIFKEVKNARDPLNCNAPMEKVNVEIGFKLLTIHDNMRDMLYVVLLMS